MMDFKNISMIYIVQYTYFILLSVIYLWFSSNIILLYLFIIVYNNSLVVFFSNEKDFEILIFFYFSFFIIIFRITETVIALDTIAVFCFSLLYTFGLYLSRDDHFSKEILRITIVIIVFCFLFFFTERITFLVLVISLLSLFWYNFVGKYLFGYLLYYILFLPETDSPIYNINKIFSFVFYNIVLFFGIWRDFRTKFFHKIGFLFFLRGFLWIIAYIFGSYKLFILVTVVLNFQLIINTIVELPYTNICLINKITSGLTNKQNNKLLGVLYILQNGNSVFAELYKNISLNYFVGQNIDISLAIQFHEFSKKHLFKDCLEKIYFLEFLKEVIDTGENRYYTRFWYAAENLSRNKFFLDQELKDNIVAWYLLKNDAERMKNLYKYRNKDFYKFNIVRDNPDSLIIKSPTWYINISSGLNKI